MVEPPKSRVLMKATVRHLALNGLPIAFAAIAAVAMLIASHWVTALLWVIAFLLVIFVPRFLLYLFLIPAVAKNAWDSESALVLKERRIGMGYPRSQLFFCTGPAGPVVYRSYAALVEPEDLGKQNQFMVGVPGRRMKAIYSPESGGLQVVRRLSRRTAKRKRAQYLN